MDIKIKCDVKDRAPLDLFLNFQGRLKELSEEGYKRLKREIIQTGFAFPIFVWENPKDKSLNILAGHQRILALKKMREEGAVVPEIPYVKIEAKNRDEAKRRVLQDVSQYGQVTPIGLLEYMRIADIEFAEIASSFVLPDFDLGAFQSEFFPNTLETKEVTFTAKVGVGGTVVQDLSKEWSGMPEFDQDDKTSFRHVVIHFRNAEDAETFFKLIDHGDTGKTRSIWFPPQENLDTETRRYADEE